MNIPENILQGWTVLVVEDEPDSAEVASVLLKMYGATVVVAKNGREGLEMIHQYLPRFVITDLTMPEMNGWEMTEALKTDDRVLASIPVIALTAHAMSGDRNRALKTGFLNYLTKPLQPDTFVHQLLELLAYDIPELKQVLEQNNP